MRVHVWFRRIAVILPLFAVFCLPLSGCDDTQAPELPTSIEIVTGNDQYSKRGTELPEPLRVRLRYAKGGAAADFNVSFKIVQLSGTLSASTDRTNDGGLAVTTLTLPDATGEVLVRASLEGSASVFVDFTATSSDFYCPQDDPAFARNFSAAGNLFLFTNKSILHAESGIVKIVPGLGKFDATDALEFPVTASPVVPWDAAFSASGDYFLGWTRVLDDVVQINPDFSYNEDGFATLESYLGSELTSTPMGILVGCDEFGPFSVGCRDTLARWDGVSYGDGMALTANNDAVAADPGSGDIYYIVSATNGTNGALMRLPMSSGTPETVAALSVDEALGANGMEVDGAGGPVYILVDTDAVKSIVKVTAAGAKSTEVDFTARDDQSHADGIQNDLAINRQFHFLYTVDVLHGTLLLYDINQTTLVELVPNDPNTDPEALSKTSSGGGERVGLVVLP